MHEPGLWLREADVVELLSLEDAIGVLQRVYRLKATGEAANMRRSHLREGESILHAVGGSIAGLGVTGTKTWTYTAAGASPLVILFNLDDGSVRGIIEAFALGQMRTAATSGLGTRVLAREDADSLALLGTGKQAVAQARAIAAVRPISSVRVFGRDGGRRGELAAQIRDELGLQTIECAEVASAVEGAAIVTAVTRAGDPILFGEMLSPGTHVNAVGSIVPTRRELDASAVGRCAMIVADSVEQAREDAGELRAAVEAGLIDWDAVRGLDEVVDKPTAQLRGLQDITLFKALGLGLSDVALGAELISRAHAGQAGAPLPAMTEAHH